MSECLQEIVFSHNTHEFTIFVDNRQATEFVIDYYPYRFPDGCIRTDRDRISCHYSGYKGALVEFLLPVFPLGCVDLNGANCQSQKVPMGYNSNKLAV